MTDIERKTLGRIAGEGTFWNTAGSVLSKATTFLTVFIVLHSLTVYEYGVFQLTLTIFSVGGLFILSNLSDVVIADVGIEKDQRPQIARGILVGFFSAQMALSVIVWGAVFFMGPFFANQFFSPETVPFVRAVSFFFLLAPARALFTIFFTVYLRFFELTLFGFLEEVFRLVLVFIGLVLLDGGVITLLFAYVLAQACSVFAMLPVFIRAFRAISQRTEKVSIFGIIARHGKWALAVSYISNLNKSLRVWMIKLFLGTEVVGLYSVALSLYGHVKSLFPLGTVVSPMIPQQLHDPERLYHLLNKSLKYLTVGFAALGLVALIAFPPIIVYLFPHYAPSMALYRLLLPALLFVGLSSLVTPVFYALKEQRSLFFSYIFRILLTLILLPAFVKLFGFYGLGIEFVITTAAFAFERYIVLQKKLPRFMLSLRDFVVFDPYDQMILERFKDFITRNLRRYLMRQ